MIGEFGTEFGIPFKILIDKDYWNEYCYGKIPKLNCMLAGDRLTITLPRYTFDATVKLNRAKRIRKRTYNTGEKYTAVINL